jgi:hypothetical protein
MQMAASKQITQRKTRARSRVTNGKSLFPKEVNQRSLYYRRFRDLVDRWRSSQHCRAIDRAPTIMAALEQLEMRFALAEGGATNEDLAAYTTLSISLRRLLQEIGIKRKPRDAQQSPSE